MSGWQSGGSGSIPGRSTRSIFIDRLFFLTMVSREPPVEIIAEYNPNDPLSCRLKALHEFSRVDDYDSIIWEHGYLVVAGVLETIADTD